MSISIYAYVEGEDGSWTQVPVLTGEGEFHSSGKAFWVRAGELPSWPGIAIGYTYAYQDTGSAGEPEECMATAFAHGTFHFLTLPLDEPDKTPEPWKPPPDEVTLPPFPESLDPEVRRTSDGDLEPGFKVPPPD